MRFDKFTQVPGGLSDAQSIALGHDNAYPNRCICWSPCCARMRARARCSSAPAPTPGLLKAADEAAVKRLPQVQGQDQVQGSPELAACCRPPKRSDTARRPVHRQRAVPAGPDRQQGRGRADRQGQRLSRKSLEAAIDRRARRPEGGQPGPRASAGAEEILPGPDRARPPGQARSGDRPRRRDPPRHPGAAAAQQEQPGADRRAWRGQDGHRRGPGPAHRQRRGARDAEEQARAGAGHGGACWPAPSSAASSRSA